MELTNPSVHCYGYSLLRLKKRVLLSTGGFLAIALIFYVICCVVCFCYCDEDSSLLIFVAEKIEELSLTLIGSILLACIVAFLEYLDAREKTVREFVALTFVAENLLNKLRYVEASDLKNEGIVREACSRYKELSEFDIVHMERLYGEMDFLVYNKQKVAVAYRGIYEKLYDAIEIVNSYRELFDSLEKTEFQVSHIDFSIGPLNQAFFKKEETETGYDVYNQVLDAVGSACDELNSRILNGKKTYEKKPVLRHYSGIEKIMP